LFKSKEHIFRTIEIAWPCILEYMLVSMVVYADSFMVSSLGTNATASVGINSSVTWLINALSSGLAIGGTVLVANNLGAGRREASNEAAEQTLGVSFILSIIISIFMISVAPYIPKLMGAEPEILADAGAYLRIYSLSIFAHFCGLIVSGILRGAGDTKTPMKVQITANIVHIILNIFLIYGPWTLKLFGGINIGVWGAGLGVRGAAISTAISQTAAGLVLCFLVFDKRQIVHVEFKNLFKFKPHVIKKILSIGAPAAGERVSISVGQLLFQKIVSGLGTVAIAANFLAIMAESISYMPANGLSVSSTTLVGQSLGAKNKDDALTYAKINIGAAAIFGTISLIILVVFSEFLLGIMSKDLAVIKVGASSLKFMAMAEPLFCVNIVLVGILRAAGDTKIPLISSVVGMWLVRIASAYFFAYTLGMGLQGAWLGMALDHVSRFVVLIFRYLKKQWLESNLVEE
jgi:putative MATE family efflux protein